MAASVARDSGSLAQEVLHERPFDRMQRAMEYDGCSQAGGRDQFVRGTGLTSGIRSRIDVNFIAGCDGADSVLRQSL